MANEKNQSNLDDESATNAEDSQAKDSKPRKKKGKKKLFIALGTTAAVICIAAAGLWAWHEQPSFCSTMCHAVMSPYVESWEAGDSLAHAHAVEDASCLDCHESTIEDQVKELQIYLAGTYRTPLAPRNFDDDFCERCHSRSTLSSVEVPVDYESVPDRLLNLLEEGGYDINSQQTINPHTRTIGLDASNPHVEGAELPKCSTCHSVHKDTGTSLQSCYSCHHTQTFASCSTCHTTLQE